MSQQLKQLTLCHPEQQKQLRRTLLGHWLARDCSALSAMGIRKAAIEAIYLRSWHDQIAIVFWYCLTGLTGALIYKVVLLLGRSWRTQGADFKRLLLGGRWLLDWAPQLLWAGWLLFTSWRPLTKENRRQAWRFSSKPRGALLLAATAQHGCDTGGPVYYGSDKLQRPRLKGTAEPSEQAIWVALQSINLRIFLLVSLLWLLAIGDWLWFR